jgi:hypothetical protein
MSVRHKSGYVREQRLLAASAQFKWLLAENNLTRLYRARVIVVIDNGGIRKDSPPASATKSVRVTSPPPAILENGDAVRLRAVAPVHPCVRTSSENDVAPALMTTSWVPLGPSPSTATAPGALVGMGCTERAPVSAAETAAMVSPVDVSA